MDFNWTSSFYNFYHLGLAWVIALPIALNREQESNSAGLRTFPLVSLGACAFMLVGTNTLTDQEPLARIFYGVITGIGFIGGGAILKTKESVNGTATAASLWCTGAIGVAVALNKFDIAVMISAFNYVTFKFKKVIGGKGERIISP